MRSLIGLTMLVAAGLFGIEYVTTNLPSLVPNGEPLVQATLMQSAMPAASPSQPLPLPPVPAPTFGGLIQTVAATQPSPLPPVTVAPQAPHATPIDPIVTPAPRTLPKAPLVKTPVAKAGAGKTVGARPIAGKATAAKVKAAKAHETKPAKTGKASTTATGVTVTRPGFKLTCTSAQKLDGARQRCVPLKTASVRKTKD